MKKTWFLPAAAALLLVGCAQNEPKDAQEVIGQYEAATGLSGVTKDTPLMLKLRMNMSDSTKMYCTFIVNPPQERLRLEMSVNGQTAIFAVDGQQGWMLPPDGSGVQVLPKEQIEAFSQQFNALSGIKWDTADLSLDAAPFGKERREEVQCRGSRSQAGLPRTGTPEDFLQPGNGVGGLHGIQTEHVRPGNLRRSGLRGI